MEKMEVDYASEVDAKLEVAKQSAAAGNLDEAIDTLLALEKLARTGADTHSTTRLLVAIVRLCYEHKDWSRLNANIELLSRRRGQIRQSIQAMVQEAMNFLEETPDLETKLKLIETLRSVTEGKIFVEVERARLTLMLSRIREHQLNDLDGAAKVLLELQVETFGSMERSEKIEMLLEQMRLCLARDDYVRTQIIGKKISTRSFQEDGTHELKRRYYELMIRLDLHYGNAVQTARHYLALFSTPQLMEDKQHKTMTLKNIILYLLLAPYEPDQLTLVHSVRKEKHLDEIPLYRDLLDCFIKDELIIWQQLCDNYEQALRRGSETEPATDVFSSSKTDPNSAMDVDRSASATGDGSNALANGEARWATFKERVVEHNIRIMSKFYTRIRIDRMSQLLSLDVDTVEQFVSKLVVNGTIKAKMDRIEGVTYFRQTDVSVDDALNEWSYNINHLMQLINKSMHLITKEEMVYKYGGGPATRQASSQA